MIPKKDLLVLTELRKDSRQRLTEISRQTRIPVSTLFDRVKTYKGGLVTKFTALLNFALFGFNTRATIILKVNKPSRERIKRFLWHHPRVNSLYKINNGYDYMIEGLFYNVKELEYFLEELETRFDVLRNEVYYIIEDIKRESFLGG